MKFDELNYLIDEIADIQHALDDVLLALNEARKECERPIPSGSTKGSWPGSIPPPLVGNSETPAPSETHALAPDL